MLTAPLWKPLVQRAVTGRWRRPRLTRTDAALPRKLSSIGLYLHVPFCKSLCPFCPYHRVLYDESAYRRYARAVVQEADQYAASLAGVPVASLYIGGGTPTVHPAGLVQILEALAARFSMPRDTCIELHPAHMDEACLSLLHQTGVTMLSIGLESLNDRVLGTLKRGHDGATGRDAVRRAVHAGFDSVNVDLMFAIPGQSLQDWEKDVAEVLDSGADQISTYPLFSFPYSELGMGRGLRSVQRPSGRLVRGMLRRTSELARSRGFERCAVWSWRRPGKKKFSSITRHHYLGLGPSAASMIGSHFWVNTFDLDAYADCLPSRRPIAVSLRLDRRMEMAYWLYWRVYELDIGADAFARTFGRDASLTTEYGHLLFPLRLLGMLRRTAEGYRISERGAYWIHRLQNEYSLNYINRLWGACRRVSWPEEVRL